MKIAVVGAGFTGLSAAFYLSELGHDVTVFEKDSYAGGLAVGYKEKKWEWSLEKFYHHWFTNDKNALSLAKEIGFETIIKKPKTSVYINDAIYKLDSARDVIKFPLLNSINKLKMSLVLGFLHYNPFWKPLEKYKTSEILPKFMGETPYQMIWEPLLINKFQKYADNISLAWFWARIKKRTQALAYPKGGFLKFANKLTEKIKQSGGKVNFNSEITGIKNERNTVSLCFNDLNHFSEKRKVLFFDKVIVTIPSFLFLIIAPQLPKAYKIELQKLKGLGALNLVLRLKKSFLKDGTYWLNICDRNSPLMAIIEHTNFMDKKYYNNEHLIYLGNYLANDHPHMKMAKEELLKIYDPFLKKINTSYQESIIDYQLFKSPFAQPIIPINYSKIIPSFETPLKNIYLANIQQVYPWDRGTNYAIELGKKIAKIVMDNI